MPGDPGSLSEAHEILTRHTAAENPTSTISSVEVADTIAPSDINEVFPDASSDSASSVEWLKTVTNKQCFPADATAIGDVGEGWQYSQRRQAQEILPFLLLGPKEAAKDEAFLKQAKITMVMAVRDASTINIKLLQPLVAERLGLECVKIEFTADRVISKFPTTIAAINRHLKERWTVQYQANAQRAQVREKLDMSLPAKILVYDLDGNGPAALVVGAYIAAAYGAKAWEATFIVQSRRFCVNAQHLHAYMLRWQTIVEAKKQIRQASTPAQGDQTASTRKRSLEAESDDDDGDWTTAGMERLGVGNEDRAHERTYDKEPRKIAAPFADREDEHNEEDYEMA